MCGVFFSFVTAVGSPTLVRETRRKVLIKEAVKLLDSSGFGGLEVTYWPLVPKFTGSNPAEAVEFLRVNKNPQHVGGHGYLSVVIVVCCQV